MRPKMTDVAKLAGVSLATVSRVLNNSKFVDPDLRERVERAIADVNYQPDVHAQWLSSKKSTVIGLIMPSVEDSNLAAFLHACTTALRDRGFDVMVALSDGDKRLESELIAAQIQFHVSGVIFISREPDNKTKGLFARAGIPVLYALNADTAGAAPSIVFDDEGAARSLMRGALSALPRGGGVHVLACHREDPVTEHRVAGYVSAAEEAGIAAPRITDCDSEIEGGYAAVQSILNAGVPRLLATTSDYLAIAAIRVAHEMDIAVPSQTAILGFGENIYSHTCVPSITTARLDGRELGRRCGESIISLTEGKTPERLEMLGFRLVAGESCPLGEAR